MKKQSIKKSLMWMRTYLVTFITTIASFSFLTTEWKSIFQAGEEVYKVARPFAEKWLGHIAQRGKHSLGLQDQLPADTVCNGYSC